MMNDVLAVVSFGAFCWNGCLVVASYPDYSGLIYSFKMCYIKVYIVEQCKHPRFFTTNFTTNQIRICLSMTDYALQ